MLPGKSLFRYFRSTRTPDYHVVVNTLTTTVRSLSHGLKPIKTRSHLLPKILRKIKLKNQGIFFTRFLANNIWHANRRTLVSENETNIMSTVPVLTEYAPCKWTPMISPYLNNLNKYCAQKILGQIIVL